MPDYLYPALVCASGLASIVMVTLGGLRARDLWLYRDALLLSKKHLDRCLALLFWSIIVLGLSLIPSAFVLCSLFGGHE